MLSFNLKVDNLFVEAQASNPDYSATLDVQPFVGNVFINVAANATNNDTPAITVEHSADDSSYAAVPASALFSIATGDAATFGSLVAATAFDTTLGLNRQQLKRYVRVVMTGAVSSARTLSITAVGQPQYTEA
jgi:hypothetical protein